MSLIRIQRDLSRRQLALFGAAWMAFFGVVGWMVFRSTGLGWAATACWALAVVVPAVGWIVPAFMRIVYLGMAYAAFPIGMLVSVALLAVVYYLVLTPTGLLLRLWGRDAMGRRFDREAPTYWRPAEETDDPARYFQQY
jgi:hypothetical protein